jgi:hypothetical protein
MPITLNGSGTVSGISAGGLPDGIIQSADLATGVGGKILQFQSVKYDTYLSTTSSSYIDSGLTCNITPISSNSKIVIVGRIQLTKFNYTCIARLLRDSTEIGSNSDSGTNTDLFTFYTNSYASLGVPFMMDDTPNTTSQVTYKLQIKSDGGTATIYVNGHNNNTGSYYSVSYMSLMEIAA